ncbi:nucleotidyltransferase family protein [Streptomyces aquilus]|uniref:nucleotidyltransferase family protein n=1 Tax=Streptomyces aquilus TaxID=2548456 RepID=UPI00368B3174
MTQHGDDTAGRRSDVAELHLASEEPEPLLRGGSLAHDSLTDDADPEELPVDRNQAILQAAKRTGALLKQTGLPFALAGSVAVYAHGGAQNLQHDVDFCIRPEDAEAVAEALRAAGLPVRRPPEDWLLKATCLGQQVDLIFELAHQPVTTELLGRARNLSVESVHMPVLAPTDLMRSLMAAFSEHHCDFGAVLPIARTLREKIDWDEVRRTCAGAPMPDAFLYFLERLDVIPPHQSREEVSR